MTNGTHTAMKDRSKGSPHISKCVPLGFRRRWGYSNNRLIDDKAKAFCDKLNNTAALMPAQ